MKRPWRDRLSLVPINTPERGTSDWNWMILAALTGAVSFVVAASLIAVGIGRSFDAAVAPTPTRDVRPTTAPGPAVAVAASPQLRAAAAPIVCLDPGHGGIDWGAVRESDEALPTIRESDINLSYAMDLAARLRTSGVTVVLTRQTDSRVNLTNSDSNADGTVGPDGQSTRLDDLQARINVCNEAHAGVLLSLHINSSDVPADEGYEVWYTADRPFGQESRRFAQLIGDQLRQQYAVAGFEAFDRGVHDDGTSNELEGRFKHLILTGPAIPGLIVPSAMPGAIAEPLVLSNQRDAAFMLSPEGRDTVITAYERAILKFFQKPD